ncbi:hypothetical protein [Mesorhizobium argentiipisi]|uniref:Uncharacterized protein n=1 Tax=Mesorhizobium argentiipisi TaxID=3015175 RepID=A0ABU8KEX1_9HYPH
MVKFLNRESFCALVGMEVNTFKSLRQRGQVPAVWGDDPEREAARGFTDTATFLMMLADELYENLAISRERSAEIAARAFMVFTDRWQEVCDGSAALVDGKKPSAEILYGVVDMAGAEPICVCGAFAQIAAEFVAPSNVVTVNITRLAAKLRRRASDLGIDIEDFWHPERWPGRSSAEWKAKASTGLQTSPFCPKGRPA